MARKHLLDVALLWQQMDGPQANAIVEGGRGWWKSWCLDLLDYFRGWNLDTATGRHLDFIGLIIGIARPILPTSFYFDQAFKYWTAPIEYNNPTSFSVAPSVVIDPHENPIPMDRGGVFDYGNLADRPIEDLVDMSDDDYRFLLKTIVDSKGEMGSLIFLDELCAAYAGNQYIIRSAPITVSTRPEDIEVYLTKYDPVALRGISAVTNEYISPFPRIYVNMIGSV